MQKVFMIKTDEICNNLVNPPFYHCEQIEDEGADDNRIDKQIETQLSILTGGGHKRDDSDDDVDMKDVHVDVSGGEILNIMDRLKKNKLSGKAKPKKGKRGAGFKLI